MQPQSDVTALFRAALAGGSVPDFVTAKRSNEAAQRFAVYRNNVAHSLREALARRFPVVQRLVGAQFFAAMAGEFIAEHPPRQPVLQEWGGDFAAFLTQFPPVATLPYLADVARIEWARGLAYNAADRTPIDPDALCDDRALNLHPGLQMLRLDHPAVSIWQANQPGGDGRVLARGTEVALIWRRPDLSVGVQALDLTDAAFLQALVEGGSLSDAARFADPVPMLTLLLRENQICTPSEDTPCKA